MSRDDRRSGALSELSDHLRGRNEGGHDMKRLTFDVLVVGAGPAGLAAVASAARSGAAIGLIDDNPAVGGQIWRGGPHAVHTAQAAHWVQRAGAGNVHLLTQTRVIAPLGRGALRAETVTEPLEARYEQLILAPGARELFLPFPGWTLPGVLGAGGLQALVKGGLPIRGKRVVVAGSGPLLLAVGSYLQGKGACVRLIAEQTSWTRLARFTSHVLRDPLKLGQAGGLGWSLRGVPLRTSCWVVHAHGTEQLDAVTVRRHNGARAIACDYLACGFGLVPNLELPGAWGCAAVAGAVRVDEWQHTSRAGVFCAGEATGIGGLDASVVEGRIAGFAATGQVDKARALFPQRARAHRFAAALDRAFAPRDELKALAAPDTIVCRCEDVPYSAIRQHASWRDAKLHTRCGMGPCQGRICGAATRFLCGWTQDSVRPPITAARLGSLAQVSDPHTVGEESGQ